MFINIIIINRWYSGQNFTFVSNNTLKPVPGCRSIFIQSNSHLYGKDSYLVRSPRFLRKARGRTLSFRGTSFGLIKLASEGWFPRSSGNQIDERGPKNGCVIRCVAWPALFYYSRVARSMPRHRPTPTNMTDHSALPIAVLACSHAWVCIGLPI